MFWDRFLGFCRKRRFFRAKAEDRLAGGLEEASLVDYRAAWIQPPMYHTARQWSEDYKPEAYGFPDDGVSGDLLSQKFGNDAVYLYTSAAIKWITIAKRKDERTIGLGVFMGYSHPLTCSIRAAHLFDSKDLKAMEIDEMEVLAAIIALKLFKAWEVPEDEKQTLKPPNIVIRTGSITLINGLQNIEEVYKDPGLYGRANDYLKQLFLLARGFGNGVKFQYVENNASDPGNLEAARLAAWPGQNLDRPASKPEVDFFHQPPIAGKKEPATGRLFDSSKTEFLGYTRGIVTQLFEARPDRWKKTIKC